jgi:hypothetical protein
VFGDPKMTTALLDRPTVATSSKLETTASASRTARRKPQTRKGETSKLDERLTPKTSSSRSVLKGNICRSWMTRPSVERRRSSRSDLLTDPAARYTASANSVAGYAQAEVTAAKTMIDRTAEQFDVTPSRLVADGATARPRWLGGWWMSVGSST